MHQRVLLVDDEPLNREIGIFLLGELGNIAVDLAADGREAVEMAKNRFYDLVLMDLQMPVMDGIEATRRIREIDGYETIPILALTANSKDDVWEPCQQAGMNGYLSKPVVPETFFPVMRRWLKL
ncbi:MAG: response regulator [Rhodocyclaceae bacterium]|nr:response regulator [Rhodocyclaceae bacterium]